jgi:hypothetical protein
MMLIPRITMSKPEAMGSAAGEWSLSEATVERTKKMLRIRAIMASILMGFLYGVFILNMQL